MNEYFSYAQESKIWDEPNSLKPSKPSPPSSNSNSFSITDWLHLTWDRALPFAFVGSNAVSFAAGAAATGGSLVAVKMLEDAINVNKAMGVRPSEHKITTKPIPA